MRKIVDLMVKKHVMGWIKPLLIHKCVVGRFLSVGKYGRYSDFVLCFSDPLNTACVVYPKLFNPTLSPLSPPLTKETTNL